MGTPDENYDKGVEYRLAGNEAFKKQDYKQGKLIHWRRNSLFLDSDLFYTLALQNYYNALLHLKALGGTKEKEKYKEASETQLVMIYNNMTAVFAKQERWDRVLFYAKKASELDPKNTKTKFRMGQAYLRLENVDEAKTLLEQVLAENPGGTHI